MLTYDGKNPIIVLAILIPLSTAFLGLRLRRKQKALGLDDWVICLAIFFFYLQAIGIVLRRKPRYPLRYKSD